MTRPSPTADGHTARSYRLDLSHQTARCASLSSASTVSRGRGPWHCSRSQTSRSHTRTWSATAWRGGGQVVVGQEMVTSPCFLGNTAVFSSAGGRLLPVGQ